MQRKRPDRIGDILELDRAGVADCGVEPPLDKPKRLLGETNASGLANAFESRGNIDAIAHQVAVGLLDHVPQVDANAELDAPLRWQADVSLCCAVLQLDSAIHGDNHAAKLDEAAVAGPLDDAPVMRVDGGIDEIAPKPPQPREGANLVRTGQLAVADDVRDQNSRDLTGSRHGEPSLAVQAITSGR